MLDLTEPLVQLIKTGAAKPALRVDAIYSFLLVSKIAAVHIKASELHLAFLPSLSPSCLYEMVVKILQASTSCFIFFICNLKCWSSLCCSLVAEA